MVYLCEGTKILFRMGYAIMKKLHERIILINEPAAMIPTLKKEGPAIINDSQYIINWGFKLALTRYNNTYAEQKQLPDLAGLKLDSKVLIND